MRKPQGMPGQLSLIAVVIFVGTALAGCAGMPDLGSNASAKPVLVVDPSDPCHVEREEFVKSKSYFTDEIIHNVGTGALIGAGVGLVGGTIIGMNPLKSAAIGAGVGAAAGGVTSYSQIMAQKYKDQAELEKNVNADLTKEDQEIDHTKASFARLRACRFQVAASIKTQVRARKMERPTAMQQLSVQKGFFAEEIALAKEYRISMDKRGDQFKSAVDEINQQEMADTAQARALQHAAAVSIPEKRASFGKEITGAENDSEIAFNIDSSKKVARIHLPWVV